MLNWISNKDFIIFQYTITVCTTVPISTKYEQWMNYIQKNMDNIKKLKNVYKSNK